MLTNLGELSLLDALKARRIPGAKYWAKFAKGVVGTAISTIFSASTTGELYSYFVPSTLWFASTSNLDAVGQSGCRYIRIYGLDADGNEINERIALSGQTPVESTLVYSRIYRVQNDDVGTHNALGQIYGDITSAGWVAGEPPTIRAHIDNGLNQSQMGFYTVPKGYKLMIVNIWFNSQKAQEVETYFVYRQNVDLQNPANTPVFRIRTNVGLYQNNEDLGVGDAPLVLDELSEFEFRANTTAGSEQVYAIANGYLIPNKYFGK